MDWVYLVYSKCFHFIVDTKVVGRIGLVVQRNFQNSVDFREMVLTICRFHRLQLQCKQYCTCSLMFCAEDSRWPCAIYLFYIVSIWFFWQAMPSSMIPGNSTIRVSNCIPVCRANTLILHPNNRYINKRPASKYWSGLQPDQWIVYFWMLRNTTGYIAHRSIDISCLNSCEVVVEHIGIYVIEFNRLKPRKCPWLRRISKSKVRRNKSIGSVTHNLIPNQG